MRLMPKRKAAVVATGLIVATLGAIVAVMWVSGSGIFATTKATTTATTTVKIQVFNPANEVESRAYFVSLLTSTKATQAQIVKQERVIKNDPSVSNQTNLVGLKQQCTLLVTQYNTAALAIAPKAFRAVGLPPQISPDKCSP
jgi:hypothetical protein